MVTRPSELPATAASVAGTQAAASEPARQSLRAYQQQLAERTRSASQSSLGARRLLGCIAAGHGWLIDIGDASELIPLPPLSRVPNTQPWFMGLVSHRGHLLSVVDFDVFIGGQLARRPAGRLIVLSERCSPACALHVSEICGLMSPSDLAGPDHTPVPFVAAWAGPSRRYQGKVWHHLNVRALLADRRFADAALPGQALREPELSFRNEASPVTVTTEPLA